MKNVSIKSLARWAGVVYLLMIPFGVMGILFVQNTILVPGDMVATIDNVMANKGLFHLSILSSVVVQLLQIALVLLLFKLFKPVSKMAAVLMLAFIVPGVSIAMLNEASFLSVGNLLDTPSYLALFGESTLQGMVALLFDMHQAGVMIAQVFWGLWLFPLGYLVYRSGFAPRLIGVLLMIGCFGYLTDAVLYILAIDPGFMVSEYTFLGEILLPLWLIIYAGKVEREYPVVK